MEVDALPGRLSRPSVGSSTIAVVALKPFARAKSRLSTLPAPLRRRLAWTMAADTLAALSAVLPVLVVGAQPALASRLHRAGLQATVVPEPRLGGTDGGPRLAGINAALRHGEAAARGRGATTVLACVGDLPALRPASVAAVLAAAPLGGRGFLADAAGVGTTMLIARETALEPHFQGRSAAAHHASGALSLTDERLGGSVPDARCDVDDAVDLSRAHGLGLGPRTMALFDAGGMLGRYLVITVVSPVDAEHGGLAVTAGGVRVGLPAGSVPDLRCAAPGQRLHAVLGPPDEAGRGSVLSAWL